MIGVGANGSAVARARLHRRRRRRTPPTARSAQPLKSLPSDRVAGERDDHQLRVRDQRGDAARVGGRRAQVLRAGEDQGRHVRAAAPAAGGGGEASGQRGAVGDEAVAQRGARVERVEVPARLARAGARALRRAVLAASAERCQGNGVSSQVVSTNSASSIASELSSTARLPGTFGISPSESRSRRSSGSGSWRSAECTAAGSSARSAGFRSPASRMSSRSDLVQRRRVALARAVVDRAAERVLAQLRGQARDVGERIGRDAGAGAVRAQLFEHRRDRLEGRDRERFRAVGGHDRVEHQRFDVLGIAFGVLERDLGAVGGSVQDELFIAAGLPQRLDVFDRFLGRVGAARGSDLLRALFEELAARVRCAAERCSARGSSAGPSRRCRAGRTRADRALAERRRDRLGDEFTQRQRRLARAARERDDGVAARRAIRPACARASARSSPGGQPLRSSGTGTVAQVKPRRLGGAGDELLRRCAEEAGPASMSSSAGSRAARSDGGCACASHPDNSGTRAGCVEAAVPASTRRPPNAACQRPVSCRAAACRAPPPIRRRAARSRPAVSLPETVTPGT